ncbi:homeobox-leucine zipper protein HOX11-like isoform X2 [Olea europaea var. sylvestris]|uniref:Homeobox-leucine zipper HAT14-like n=1 Tax=Olea europaea subsp. europaea TaxID=158383 RepID=A0A8S0PMG7_OLEEU|nr:homeobox-leucine zipper protein HOX11-like isoform X2 [Olea europaea var. sylvestris]CAA2954584.1 homeobox-leucine zipper HAT14-like [Olea europaea subsp. europaea]
MELGLSLGETSKGFTLPRKSQKIIDEDDLGFCMALGMKGEYEIKKKETRNDGERKGSSSDLPLQLDLLPFSPVPRSQNSPNLRFPWLAQNLVTESGKGLDENQRNLTAVEVEDGAALSSPNSTVSSFQMDFSIYTRGKRDANEVEADRGASSKASDEEENGMARKKLRLSKEQSAFLEESFKEHNTLNPKQKLALAKQLNLRPRQVEVWFQNRRARTKLKQTEVDCEYLKRCCEKLTDENRRLQKEIQELRALKASQPFYMQQPATTLAMCPSCERVTTSTATPSITTAATTTAAMNSTNNGLSLAKPKLYSFLHAQQAAS